MVVAGFIQYYPRTVFVISVGIRIIVAVEGISAVLVRRKIKRFFSIAFICFNPAGRNSFTGVWFLATVISQVAVNLVCDVAVTVAVPAALYVTRPLCQPLPHFHCLKTTLYYRKITFRFSGNAQIIGSTSISFQTACNAYSVCKECFETETLNEPVLVLSL